MTSVKVRVRSRSSENISTLKLAMTATEHDCLAHRFPVASTGTCEVAHEPSGEGVSGSGRVMHLLQWIGRNPKDGQLFLVAVVQRGSVLTQLDHQCVRAPIEDLAGSSGQASFCRQLPRLGVIDDQDIHPFERLEQGFEGSVDPVVHGVTGYQPGTLDLGQNGPLQYWINIAEKDEVILLIGLRDGGAGNPQRR